MTARTPSPHAPDGPATGGPTRAPASDGIPSPTAAPEPDFTPEVDAEPENDILREARRVRDLAAAKARSAARDINWKTAAGIGIGSAALLAALLYAGRDRK